MDDGFYRLNRRLTTILLIGIDKTASNEITSRYRSGGQADFLALLIINDSKKSISMLQINRDTMVDLTVFNVLGQEIGTRFGQICLSHAFGNGGTVSCEMTVDAVSAFLNDIPINYYIAMNMDGIATLNDALGGIEVTLEDDFTAFDASMTSGTTLTLMGSQAEYYLRGRFSVGDQTNVSRLKRQRTYMKNAATALKQHLNQNTRFLNTLQEKLEPYLVSSLSRGALYNLGEKAGRYEFMPILEIPGNTLVGEGGFMEFYPDMAVLHRLLADNLYEKIE